MSFTRLLLGLLLLVHGASAHAGDWEDCIRSDTGNPDGRIRACTRLIDRGGISSLNLAHAYRFRGWAYSHKSQYERAIAEIDQSIRLAPTVPNAHNDLGVYRCALGQYDLAIAAYDEAIRLKPTWDWPYFGRGTCRQAKGDFERARGDYRIVLGLPSSDGGRTQEDVRRRLAEFDAAVERKRQEEEARNIAARHEAEQRAEEARRRGARAEEQRRDEEQRRHAAEAETKRKAEEASRLAALLKEGKGADAAPMPTTPLGRRIALVFGNANYQYAGRLPNPGNDARAIAARLRRLGFEDVVEHHDLGRVAIEEALKVFGDKSINADWAVIYYAGHGLQMDGRTFLLPIDVRLARAAHVEDEAIVLDRMMSKVAEARKLKLIILDACRNNPFVTSMAQDGRITRQLGRGLARIEPPGGILIAYAARDGQVAEDGEGENSPFTSALIKHLDEPGLEINMLFRKTRDSVLSQTRGNQEPFVYGSLPSEGFYFRHATAR